MYLRKIYTICALSICIAIAACSKPNKQGALLLPTWKLEGVLSRTSNATKKDSIPPEPTQKEKVKISYQFHKDKTYTFRRGNQTDKGDWGMSSDERVLLLHSRAQASENSEFHIHTLENSKLIISSEHKGKQEILYFVAQ